MARSCEDFREKMADQIHGLLSDGERREVELHLQGCDRCTAYWNELQRQDQVLSDWVASMEPGLQSGLNETLTAVRTGAGQNRIVYRPVRSGFPFRRAIAAGIFLAIGFCAGIFSSDRIPFGFRHAQAGELSPALKAGLIEEILTKTRMEIEQNGLLTQQQLRQQFEQKLEQVTQDLTQTLDRDRQWLTTTLTVLEGKRNEENSTLYKDMAKLAQMTEREFIRTKQYVDQTKYSLENNRRSDRTPADPSQGSGL